jgi:hypothetical protein
MPRQTARFTQCASLGSYQPEKCMLGKLDEEFDEEQWHDLTRKFEAVYAEYRESEKTRVPHTCSNDGAPGVDLLARFSVRVHRGRMREILTTGAEKKKNPRDADSAKPHPELSDTDAEDCVAQEFWQDVKKFVIKLGPFPKALKAQPRETWNATFAKCQQLLEDTKELAMWFRGQRHKSTDLPVQRDVHHREDEHTSDAAFEEAPKDTRTVAQKRERWADMAVSEDIRTSDAASEGRPDEVEKAEIEAALRASEVEGRPDEVEEAEVEAALRASEVEDEHTSDAASEEASEDEHTSDAVFEKASEGRPDALERELLAAAKRDLEVQGPPEEVPAAAAPPAQQAADLPAWTSTNSAALQRDTDDLGNPWAPMEDSPTWEGPAPTASLATEAQPPMFLVPIYTIYNWPLVYWQGYLHPAAAPRTLYTQQIATQTRSQEPVPFQPMQATPPTARNAHPAHTVRPSQPPGAPSSLLPQVADHEDGPPPPPVPLYERPQRQRKGKESTQVVADDPSEAEIPTALQADDRLSEENKSKILTALQADPRLRKEILTWIQADDRLREEILTALRADPRLRKENKSKILTALRADPRLRKEILTWIYAEEDREWNRRGALTGCMSCEKILHSMHARKGLQEGCCHANCSRNNCSFCHCPKDNGSA